MTECTDSGRICHPMQLSDVRDEPNNGDSLMSNTNRRTFMMQVVVGGSALATASQVMAADMVAESDATAVSLGYKADSTKVDAKKYPAHKPAQVCGNCALYQGKPTDAAGGCPLFAGKQVASKGWCSAHAPKPA